MADSYNPFGDFTPAAAQNLPAEQKYAFTKRLVDSGLSKPPDLANGESILDPGVFQRYFDDPAASEKDKELIARTFDPSYMRDAFDEQIRASVGEPVRHMGLLHRAMNHLTDIAGKPIQKTLGLLSYPADKTEQVFGLALSYAYNSDLSLSERWQLGKLTYEAYGGDGWWKHNNFKTNINLWDQQIRSGEKTVDQIIAEHEHGVPDIVGKMILDPLWLLGGLPAVPGKLYKAEELGVATYKTGVAAGFFKGLAEGVHVADLPIIGSRATQLTAALEHTPAKPLVGLLRGVFGSSVPTHEDIMNRALIDWADRFSGDINQAVGGWRNAKGLFDLTPQSKAAQLYEHLTSVIGLSGANQGDLHALAIAIERGDPGLVPVAFGHAFETTKGRFLLEAMRDGGIELRRFPSMEMAVLDPAEWDREFKAYADTFGAEVAKAGTGLVGDTATKAARSNERLMEFLQTHARGEAGFRSYLARDLHEVAFPGIQRWQGVPGAVEKVVRNGKQIETWAPTRTLGAKFTAMMKQGMGVVMLNRPGFTALNYLNNGMTLAFDFGIGRGVKYWLDPTGKRAYYERVVKPLVEDMGLNPDLVKAIVSDSSVAREVLFGTDAGRYFGLTGRDALLAPFVGIASKFDMGARIHGFYESLGRSRNAVWKFEGKGSRGLLAAVPDSLAAELGPEMTQRLKGAILAAGPDEQKLRAIVDQFTTHGRAPLTAEHYIEKLADAMRLEGDARQSFHDTFDLAFRERLNEILGRSVSGTVPDRLPADMWEKLGRGETVTGRVGGIGVEFSVLPNLDTGGRGVFFAFQRETGAPNTGSLNDVADLLSEYFAKVPDGRSLFAIPADDRLAEIYKRFGFYEVGTIDDGAHLPGTVLQMTKGDFLASPIMKRVERGTNAGDIRKAIEDFQGELRAQEHTAREVDNLPPRPRDYSGPAVSRADHEALQSERTQTRMIQANRTMQAAGVSGDRRADVLQWLSDDASALRELRNAAHQNPNLWEEYWVEAAARMARTRQHIADRLEFWPQARDLIDNVLQSEMKAWAEHHSLQDGAWLDNLGQHYGAVDNVYNDALQREADLLGFEHRPPPHAVGGEYPIAGEKTGVQHSDYNKLLEHIKENVALDMMARGVSNQVPAGLEDYIKGMAEMAPDAKRAQVMIARRMTDFAMLNYDNRYGIDQWLQYVYPYSFWPTRTMAHWAQRAAARPGATAATVKLYELMGEVNQDAGLPGRFGSAIRIPIPFLDQSLQGGPMYFDPIKVLFPLAQASQDNAFEDAPTNMWGQIDKWTKVAGLGLNPFADTALQALGGTDRALYLKYRFSSMPFLIPGPRQIQAIWSYLNAGEDPDNLLDEKTKETLALGKHLPESELQKALGMQPDEFDIYRTQRVLANMVGTFMKEGHSIDERQQLVRDALDAMFTRKGPLWNRAKKTGNTEAGLSIMTGWLTGMPVRQYPNGEDTSRGIEELFSQVQKDSRANGGGDVTKAFTDMFPEVQVRKAALSIFDGTDKQDTEVEGSLFAIDLDHVHQQYDDKIKQLDGALTYIASSGVLKTEDGRRQYDVVKAERNALSEARSQAIDDLNKRYADRNTEPSINRTPRTRALQTLESQYYAIEIPTSGDKQVDFQKQQAAQQAFLDKLPAQSDFSPFAAAVRHYETMHKYDQEISAAFDQGDREQAQKLMDERGAMVRLATADAQGKVTRREFQSYLDRNKRVPTPEENERDMASSQIAEYHAIKDRAPQLGYSSKETSALAAQYWKTHPLLEKYYGSEDVQVHSYADIQKFDRMESIWESYRSLEGGSQSRIDYLAMVLDELNGLRQHFGLKPIRITDPYWEVNAAPPRYEGSLPSGY